MFRLIITRLTKKYFPSIYQRLRVFRYEKYVFPPEFMAHVNRILPSNLVIGVGANVCLVTETLARRGVRVISFEPNSSAFLKLKRVARRFPDLIAPTQKLKARIRREGYMEKFFFDWH